MNPRTMLLAALIPATLACDEDKDTGSEDTATTTETGTPDETGTPVDTGPDETDADPSIEALVSPGGCGDLMLTLASADRSWVLAFQVSGDLTRQAYEDGKATATYTLPDDAALSLHRGEGITELFCNDVYDESITIDESWAASAGSVTVTVVSEGIDHGHATPGTATITIEDATLEQKGEADISIGSLSWEAAVGWLPG